MSVKALSSVSSDERATKMARIGRNSTSQACHKFNTEFPQRLIANIFTFLEATDVLSSRRTCRTFTSASKNWAKTSKAIYLGPSFTIDNLAAFFWRQNPLFPQLEEIRIHSHIATSFDNMDSKKRKKKFDRFNIIISEITAKYPKISRLYIMDDPGGYYDLFFKAWGTKLKHLELQGEINIKMNLFEECPHLEVFNFKGPFLNIDTKLNEVLSIPQLVELETDNLADPLLEKLAEQCTQKGLKLSKLSLYWNCSRWKRLYLENGEWRAHNALAFSNPFAENPIDPNILPQRDDTSVTDTGLQCLAKCYTLQELRLEFAHLGFNPQFLKPEKVVKLVEAFPNLRKFSLLGLHDISDLKEAIAKIRPELQLDLEGAILGHRKSWLREKEDSILRFRASP